jgi:hypothetical protein
MDDKDLEELSQLEHSSTFTSTTNVESTNIFSSSISSEAASDRTLTNVGSFGVESMKREFEHVDTRDRCDTVATVVVNMDDSFGDDFGDLEDLGDDVFELDDEDGLKPYIETAKYKRYIVQDAQDDVLDPRWPGLCKVSA